MFPIWGEVKWDGFSYCVHPDRKRCHPSLDENRSNFRNTLAFGNGQCPEARHPYSVFITSRSSRATAREKQTINNDKIVSRKQRRRPITTAIIWQYLHVSAYINHHKTPTLKICKNMFINERLLSKKNISLIYKVLHQRLIFVLICLSWNHKRKLAYIKNIIINYLLTPWSRVLLQKLIGSQPVKKFPALYWTRRFITAFTSDRNLSLSQAINPVHASILVSKVPSSYYRSIYAWVSQVTSFPRTPQQNTVCTSSRHHACFMHRPPNSSRFDHPNNIGWAVQIIKLLIMSLSPLPRYLVPPRTKYSVSTLFSNTLSLRSSLSVSDKVSHPYKTTGKIIVLYTLSFKFLESKLEDKRFCTEW